MDESIRQTILIIEDEIDIQDIISYSLRKEGYRVFCSDTGEDGFDKVKTKKPHLVILDLMLPGIDGLEVCRRIRSEKNLRETRVLMLTAKSEETDIVTGLEVGADDYLSKPFSNRELLARIRSLLRRWSQQQNDNEEVISGNGFNIHPGRREVLFNGKNIDLTTSEFKALQLLAKKPGWVLSRDQIVDGVHGPGHAITTRAIDVMMVSLRKKLGDGSKFIETVRGAGYRFKAN
jgi:two-component system phosphate regulon response regulator PhoB